MRTALFDSNLISLNGIVEADNLDGLVGLTLGYDRAAEHEQGIQELLNSFACKGSKKLGLKGFQIQNLKNFQGGEIVDVKEDRATALLYLTNSIAILSNPVHIKNYQDHPFIDKTLNLTYWTAWDKEDFLIVLEAPSSGCTAYRVFDLLFEAFTKKDIAIFVPENTNPYAGHGPMIAIYSRIPKEEIRASENSAREQLSLEGRMKKSKASLAREAKIDEWKKNHPGAGSTPWDAMFLGNPSLKGFKLWFWLNPEHQDHINANWVTEDDIMDWVNGKPGKIIKSAALWDELNWMCTKVSYRSGLIGYNLHYFNRYEPQRKRSLGDGYYKNGHYGDQTYWYNGEKMPKALKDKKLTPEFIKYVEQHIKAAMIRDLEEQLEFQYGGDVARINEITHIRKDIQDEIYGFFSVFKLMGYETSPGACNSPAVRENFSWWKNLLEEESFWEFWIKKGVAYEPWIKNGYTERSRELWHMYKRHNWKDEHGLIVLNEKLKNDTAPVSEN